MIAAPAAFTALPIVPTSSNGIAPGLPIAGLPGAAPTGDVDFLTLMFQMLAACQTPDTPAAPAGKKDKNSIVDACAVMPPIAAPGMLITPPNPIITTETNQAKAVAPIAVAPGQGPAISADTNPIAPQILAGVQAPVTPTTPVQTTPTDTAGQAPAVPSQSQAATVSKPGPEIAAAPTADPVVRTPDQPRTVDNHLPQPTNDVKRAVNAPRVTDDAPSVSAPKTLLTAELTSNPVLTTTSPAISAQVAPHEKAEDATATNVDDDAVALAAPAHQADRAAGETHPRVDEARPSAPLVEQVHDQVASHLDQLRAMGHVEVQMNLHPPELGQVQLHLALNDGHLSVRFVVQNDGARSTLTQQMEPMRVRFAEMGFSLGNFDVRRDNDSSKWQQAQESDGTGEAGQVQRAAGRIAQKGYAPVTDASAMVDVFA
ncbi:MAG TPA: flagellar hook-length control protein FliK [Gemmataceae bacterium]|nr:flagellar hook-length control protein FliK [Gemmataceae bacterium]